MILTFALITGLVYITYYIVFTFVSNQKSMVNNIYTPDSYTTNISNIGVLDKVKKRKDDYLYNIVNLRKIEKTKTSFNISKGKISIKV